MKKITVLLKIKGIVQGVGFRPFIHRLAKEYNISGNVKNTGGGVEIIICAAPADVKGFIKDIRDQKPVNSEIESIEKFELEFKNYEGFSIDHTEGRSSGELNISADICVCDDCQRELNDKNDVRYDYPFINCTNCGPRFTLLEKLPYDRENTSMQRFEMCDLCKSEYNDIDNRRYHAQPICCPNCGPRYFLGDISGIDAIKKTADLIKNGDVVGVKSWGGFHLYGNAFDKNVIKKVRIIKKRPLKPIALLARDIETVKKYCILDKGSEELLSSKIRPIVLLEKKVNADLLKDLSPDNKHIGIMLCYSPVQHLLFKYLDIDLLIATSMNPPSQPTFKNKIGSGYKKIRFLDHDIELSFHCDDSVLKNNKDGMIFLRRARGYVPGTIGINHDASVLSSGASENINFCFTQNKKAYISQYFGDIKDANTQKVYENDIEKWIKIWNFKPSLLICDMHPNYNSTLVFEKLSNKWGLPLKKVQHHHAHVASCAVENGMENDVIGIAFDGMGYGDDGRSWGGEFLVSNYNGYKRYGHLEYMEQPGGDLASFETWRMAFSYLYRSGIDIKSIKHFAKKPIAEIERMLKKNINCPLSSSMGRLFDCIGAMIGLGDNIHSSRVPIALENIADERYMSKGYGFDLKIRKDKFTIDVRELIAGVYEDIMRKVSPGIISAKFHYSIADMALQGALFISKVSGIKDVCLSGGVFCNHYLSFLIKQRSADLGLKIFTHKKISPNDNGISLGQSVLGTVVHKVHNFPGNISLITL